MVRFDKMHGLGNDFVVIDARAQSVVMTPPQARAIANRHTGIGCDQLIVLEANETVDATMRIWNADGSEVSACGNAARAVAQLIGRSVLQTGGGTIAIVPGDGGASVDMGLPRFDWDAVPLAYAVDTTALPLAWGPLGKPAALNVGNPHLVFFVDDVASVALGELGPVIEHDAMFPERINVNVAQLTGPNSIVMRTWERGAGLTRACGTGACATAVAAVRARLVASPVMLTVPGGSLTVEWVPGGTMALSGAATHVFGGTIDLAALTE